MEDVRWLGFNWDGLVHASDYFDQLYAWRCKLMKAGKAYVDDLSADEIREYRGTLTEPGKDSPYRNRSVEENLDLFERMQAGSLRTARGRCARRSTWLRRISICGIRHVPHPARFASPNRRQVVHLSDVRLCARQSDSLGESHTRSARWSLKIIVRFTIGSSSSWASFLRSRSSLSA